jgi:small subunit ribosomal protein S6
VETLYEAMLIVDPSQSDDELSATIEEAKSIITRADGKVESAYPVFRRRLAYPIQDRTEGTYVLVYFRGSQAVDELKRDLQMSTAILRIMVVEANPLALWLEGPPHAPAPQRRGGPAEAPDAPKPEAAAKAEAEPEAAPEAPAEAESATPDEPEAPADAEPEAAPEAPPQEEDGAESSEAAPEDESPQQDASS